MFDLLQKFLSLGLLDIGDDDTRLAKLRDSATELQQRFLNEPRVGMYHALMIYSGNVDSEDQCFTEGGEVLAKHWPTYMNRYTDVPRGILRGIAFQALSGACESSSNFESGVAYGLRSLGEHPAATKDGTLLEEFYRTIETHLEERAIAAWQVGGTDGAVGGG